VTLVLKATFQKALFFRTKESAYRLEMLVEAEVVRPDSVAGLLAEADELTAIMATSRKTAKQNG